jgi:hypothetical protein
VYGPECLAEVLGPDGATGPAAVPSKPRNLLSDLAGLGLLVAVVASILPWTRFGQPSGLFGGWGINPQRWSSLASYASFVGLVLWVAWRPGGVQSSLGRSAILLGLGVATAAGAVLHILNPPPFTHAWLGPWVSIGGAALAVAASARPVFAPWSTKHGKRSAP